MNMHTILENSVLLKIVWLFAKRVKTFAVFFNDPSVVGSTSSYVMKVLTRVIQMSANSRFHMCIYKCVNFSFYFSLQ